MQQQAYQQQQQNQQSQQPQQQNQQSHATDTVLRAASLTYDALASLPDYTRVEIGKSGSKGFVEGLVLNGLLYEGIILESQNTTTFHPGRWSRNRFVCGISFPTLDGFVFLPGVIQNGAFVPGAMTSRQFGFSRDGFVGGFLCDTQTSFGRGIVAGLQAAGPVGFSRTLHGDQPKATNRARDQTALARATGTI